MKWLLTTLILAGITSAADLPEVNKLRLLSIYQKALIAQTDYTTAQNAACQKDPDCREKQTQFSIAVQEFTVESTKTVKELKLPEGTSFQVDPAKGTVTEIAPKK